LVLHLLGSRQPVVVLGVLAAMGIHLALVAIMATQHAWCIPCLLTAGSVCCAALTVLYGAKSLAQPISALIAGVAIGITLFAVGQRIQAAATKRAALAAAHDYLRNQPLPAPGTVVLILLTRTGCSHCNALKSGSLRELELAMGDRLNVQEHQAPEGLATPTLIFHGERNVVSVGDQPIASLRYLVQRATDVSSPQTRGATEYFAGSAAGAF
jgi:hypothetical protein